MRPTLAILLLVAAMMPPPAFAEDFTGFYAGVNAGHIAERGGRSGPISFPPGGVADAETRLPPSALDAAERMTGRDARARPQAPRR